MFNIFQMMSNILLFQLLVGMASTSLQPVIKHGHASKVSHGKVHIARKVIDWSDYNIVDYPAGDLLRKEPLRLTLCRTLFEDENCARTLPVDSRKNKLPNLFTHLTYVIKIEEPRFRHFGRYSQFVPYNCHLLRVGQERSFKNALIYGGEGMHDSVAVIYRENKAAKMEFKLANVLKITNTSDFDSYRGTYHIECDIVECSNQKDAGYDTCPQFNLFLDAWKPRAEMLSQATLTGNFGIRIHGNYSNQFISRSVWKNIPDLNAARG